MVKKIHEIPVYSILKLWKNISVDYSVYEAYIVQLYICNISSENEWEFYIISKNPITTMTYLQRGNNRTKMGPGSIELKIQYLILLIPFAP